MAIRITQAGVALTVGIIIVTGLIIGGFFLVKNSGEQARREEAIKIADQNIEEQNNDDVALDTESSEENGAPAEEEAPADTPESTDTDGTTQEVTPTNESAVEALPQTGPADQLSSAIILSLLAFSVASYVASRRQV